MDAVQEIKTHKVLVIEDDENLNNLYSHVIRKAGYQVSQALTTREAYKLLDAQMFDVLLCDIRMGDGRGTDLLARRKDSLKAQGTQVIVISAEPQYQHECEGLGIELFLMKPVALRSLVQFVNRLLSSRS